MHLGPVPEVFWGLVPSVRKKKMLTMLAWGTGEIAWPCVCTGYLGNMRSCSDKHASVGRDCRLHFTSCFCLHCFLQDQNTPHLLGTPNRQNEHAGCMTKEPWIASKQSVSTQFLFHSHVTWQITGSCYLCLSDCIHKVALKVIKYLQILPMSQWSLCMKVWTSKGIERLQQDLSSINSEFIPRLK